MNTHLTRKRLLAAALLGMLTASGCDGGRNYQAGLAAEKRGDESRAYDEYLRAGARHRGGGVAQAIERVAPLAASEAESSALAAMDEGRHEDAWRMLMRTLEIQPNHPNAPQLIRRLEQEHPNEIAAAKSDYMRRGFAALAMIPPSALSSTTLAQAVPPTSPRVDPEPPRKSSKPEVQTPESVRSVTPRREPEKAEPKKPEPTTTEQPSRRVTPKPEVSPRDAPTPATQPERETQRAQQETQDQRGDYLVVHTLSLRDRRYPRLTRTVDGITIRLRDTDDDLEVDLDLYDGERRIQKVRELELGRSQTFRGRSGELYRLTVLGIHHKSRTARIGVRPA